MKKEKKSHKEVGHWPYLAIVAVVAVVAVVFLVMKGGTTPVVETSSSEVPSEIEIYDEEGNIAGAARWSGGAYRQTARVARSDDEEIKCTKCTETCSVCGGGKGCELCERSTNKKTVSLR